MLLDHLTATLDGLPPALALPIAVSPARWWTVQCIAPGELRFTLFIQAPTIGLPVARLISRKRA